MYYNCYRKQWYTFHWKLYSALTTYSLKRCGRDQNAPEGSKKVIKDVEKDWKIMGLLKAEISQIAYERERYNSEC